MSSISTHIHTHTHTHALHIPLPDTDYNKLSIIVNIICIIILQSKYDSLPYIRYIYIHCNYQLSIRIKQFT